MFISSSQESPRQGVEKELAQGFLSILERHHRDIRQTTSLENGDGPGGISVAERKILSRISYQNWTLGLTVGALTFGVLIGITMKSAAVAARYQLPRQSPSSYRDLDAVGGSSNASRFAERSASKKRLLQNPKSHRELEAGVGQAMDPTSLNSEAMSQGIQSVHLHFMIIGA